jgi:hypothetical protein
MERSFDNSCNSRVYDLLLACPVSCLSCFAGMAGYQQLLNQCWAQAPGDRPTFEVIVQRLRALL